MVKWDVELGPKSANIVPPQYVCSYFYWLWLAALQFAFADSLLIFPSVENTNWSMWNTLWTCHVKYTMLFEQFHFSNTFHLHWTTLIYYHTDRDILPAQYLLWIVQ